MKPSHHSYHPLRPGRIVTPVFHNMPKSLSRQVRHIMSPWSLYFEHVSLMPPFTVTSLSYHPLLSGNTVGRRVTPVFSKMPKSLSRQVIHIMSPWSLFVDHVSPMPPFTRDKSMTCHLPIDKVILHVLKSSPHNIVQHQASLDDYQYMGGMMKHGRVHNSEAIGQCHEGIPDYPSGSEDAFISCQTTKRMGLEKIFSQPKGVVTYEVVGSRFVVIWKHVFDLVILILLSQAFPSALTRCIFAPPKQTPCLRCQPR